jgi:hypothetical protein
MADITPPTISITSNKTALKAGDTALITFTLSEVATDFTISDIAVTGGTLSRFSGAGMLYSATFTPSQNSTIQGSVNVGNFKFSDLAGNSNEDGLEVNNNWVFTIDTTSPTISIVTSRTYLTLNETPKISFLLSEPSTNFDISDIYADGGIISLFQGSGRNYSVTLTPNSTANINVRVSSGVFTDYAGNFNTYSTTITLVPFDSINANIAFTRFLGSTAFAAGKGLTIGIDGGIFTTGFTSGSIDGQKNSGDYDAFVTKFSPDGSKIWTRLLGTSGLDAAEAITSGSDGSIYIAGHTNGSLDGQINKGKNDAFVTKFSSDGSKIWTRLLGTSDHAYARAIATGTDNSIFLAGHTGGELDGQVNTSGLSTFIAKYSTDGTKLWTRLLSDKGGGLASLSIGIDGSVYVAGTTTATFDGQPFNGDSDAFISKYSPDGVKIWTRLFGSDKSDSASALTSGIDGSVYVAGRTTATFDGQPYNGNNDAFISKYSPDGDKIWTRFLGSSDFEEALSLGTGSDGSIYVSGIAYGSLDGQTNIGDSDAFVTKYSPDGIKIWTRLIGTKIGHFYGNALKVSKDDSIYLGGQANGSLDGEINHGGYDAFVVKLTQPDASPPVIYVDCDQDSLRIGESALVRFNLSKPSTNFIQSDITIQGGKLSNFQGSGSSYSALFTASIEGANGASVSVGSGKFSDALGIFNEDGTDANNKVSFTVTIPADTTPPTIVVTTTTKSLSASQTATVTFTLSESSSNFTFGDVTAVGGTLSNFSGSGTTYTALFTPTANSTTSATVSVASSVFTDAAGNANADGADANNLLTLAVDTVVPTIALSSAKSTLIAGETTTLTFTLSEASTTFTASDVTVTGGALSNFAGSGATYTALFTPTANSTANATVSVASGVFTDTAGNANADGSDANNLLTLAVDTLVPTIAVSSNKLSLQGGYSATLNFILSEASTNFAASDITVIGGTLSNFAGSGNSYTAIFTLVSNSAITGALSVANGVFTDTAGNKNADGSDANNSVVFTRIPTITNETHTLSVIVDKNVLGTDAVLLKGLKELMTFTNGAITMHIVEYAGSTFDYNQIDSLITTVTRDDEFTAEFTKEINAYLNNELNITYSAAVAIVGAASIDGIILSVAGSDGNFVV